MNELRILKPWNQKEAITLRQAAEIAGRCVETMRLWAGKGLGRKILGQWAISHPALLMKLEDDVAALKAYWSGDRTGPLVRPYFERVGLVF